MNFTGPWSDWNLGLPITKVPTQPRPDIRKLRTSKGFPIALEDLKEDLRVDGNDEDRTVMRLARAAAAFLEKRTAWAIIPGRYEANFSAWCLYQAWQFDRVPLRSIIEISWLDGSQSPPTWVDVPISDFFVSERERNFLVIPLATFSAPTLWAPFNGIRVRFDAGFDVLLESGDDQFSEDDSEPKELDDGLRTLLTMLTAHYYQNRELFLADKTAQVEASAGSLLAGYRQLW